MDTRIICMSRLLFITTVLSVSAPLAVFAAPTHVPEIQIIDIDTRVVQASIPVLQESVNAGLKPLVADLDLDNNPEIVVFESTGADALPVARVYSRKGVLQKTYPLFLPEAYGQEISAAIGNIDSDPEPEIVLSFPQSQSTLVYVLDSTFRFNGKKGGFVAFPDLKTGAVVTVANVTQDSKQEIIVGTAASVRAQVQVFDSTFASMGASIIPFSETDLTGVTLGSLHTEGVYKDITIGMRNGAQTWLKLYRVDSARTYPVLANERLWGREWISGVVAQGADINHDGVDEIIAVPQSDQQAEFVFLSSAAKHGDNSSVYAFEELFRGGVEFAIGQLDSDLSLELVVAPRVQSQKGDMTKGEKYVETNLTEQTVTLWENGYIIQRFLISSGLAPRQTPTGETKISYKKPLVNYDGSIFGESYFFGNTPWNLMFRSGGYFFHTAYWHNDFGRPKSHGCINMREPNAHFLYDWAPIGTTVITRY